MDRAPSAKLERKEQGTSASLEAEEESSRAMPEARAWVRAPGSSARLEHENRARGWSTRLGREALPAGSSEKLEALGRSTWLEHKACGSSLKCEG